jgi:hypothetical protein
MYKGKVFLTGPRAEGLIALEETGYIKEATLQELLARYPDLLPGDQIDPESPRRWLLVSREIGIPGDVDETGRWSLDHLFLDQDGIPTFVECKRASDTRARREVVAQMLDYASNGVEYWDVNRIRQSAAETSQQSGMPLDDQVASLIGGDTDPSAIDAFWSRVAINLRAKKVRLVFVADTIPKELRRLVEFLNEEMTNVEVLAVEVKRYAANDTETHQALVPRVIGATEAARAAKSGEGRRRFTTPDEFFAKCTPDAQDFFRQVILQAEEGGYTIYWGEVGFSVRAPIAKDGRLASFVYCYPPDKFQFHFHNEALLSRDPSSPLRRELEGLEVFAKRGEYTLAAQVSETGPTRLAEVYALILSRIETFLKQLSTTQQEGD